MALRRGRWCISYDITVEKFLHTTKLSRLSLSLSPNFLPADCLLLADFWHAKSIDKLWYAAHNLKLFSLLDLRRGAALSAELLFSSLRGNVF